ncbi:MAG: carboxylating nicotinate-nucleotide diphosphorylase [Bacteroidota bacterium]
MSSEPDVSIRDLINTALTEDVGSGDVTTLATIPAGTPAQAYFLAKADGVLSGLEIARLEFEAVDPGVAVSYTLAEGDAVIAGTRFGTVSGPARSVLVGERLALNLMQRMSGIATATRRMVDATGPHPARILDTRKTAPGLRLLDKQAVIHGGGVNHRIGLYDMILIKDNHIAAAGGIDAVLDAANAYRKQADRNDLEVEIETRTFAEIDQVLGYLARHPGSVDRVLLDNMARRTEAGLDVTMLAEAVQRIDGRLRTEASGNVTLETVPAIAATGVDFISSGALTHSVTALDISLKVQVG